MATPKPGTGLRRARIVIIAALLLLLAVAGGLAVFYTDLLWFKDLGQSAVFWTRFWSRLATGAAFGVVAFVLVWVNLVVARRMAPPAVLTGQDSTRHACQDPPMR